MPAHKTVVFFDSDFFPEQSFWNKCSDVQKICEKYDILNYKSLLQHDFAKINTLVLPYGQYFPLEIYKGIKQLLKNGGDLIVLGGAPLEKPCILNTTDWRIYDPLQIGLWKEFFHSEWRNDLGLSFHNVVAKSQWYHGPFCLGVNQFYEKAFSATSLSWDCKRYCGKLLPLKVGRTSEVMSTVPEKSAAPAVTDFVSIVEPLHSRDVNGRVLCVGFTPDDNWSIKDHSGLLESLLHSLELDKEEKSPVGGCLKSDIAAFGSELELDLWSRGSNSSAPVEIELVNNQGKTQATYAGKVDSLNNFPLEGLESGAYSLLIKPTGTSVIKYDFSILEKDSGKLPDFIVGRRNGYPVIQKDDTIIPAELYAFDPVDRHLDRIATEFPGHGIKIIHFLCPLMLNWKGENEFDWSSLDHMIERILRRSPDALLFPRILLQTPPWWDEKYPDEVKKYRSGRNYVENKKLAEVGFHYKTQLPIYSKFNNGGLSHRIKQASYYSRKWRNDVAAAMKDLSKHIQKQIWKNNFLGVFFGGGTCGEWGNFSEKGSQDWEDMSAPALNAFRDWLKNKYLQPTDRIKAWDKLKRLVPEDVKLPESEYLLKTDFLHGYFSEQGKLFEQAKNLAPSEIEKALPPTFARRHVGRYGFLKDPEQSFDSIEYFSWMMESFPEMLIEISQGIRNAFPNKIIVGTFYGYLMQEYFMDLDDGANALGYPAALASEKAPDLFVSPHYYAKRDLISGDANIKNPSGSVRLSNKIFLDENDQRTILTERENYLYYGGTTQDTMADAIEMSKRNFAARLSKNVGLWWYDLFGHGWYDHPEIMKTIAKTTKLFQRVITEPNVQSFENSDSRINVIYSVDAYKYICACSKFCYLNTHGQIQENFNRNGFRWEAFFKEDMHKAPKAKAWFFMNALNISTHEVEWINKNLKRDGNILIWLYAPGIYRDGKIDLKYTKNLTDINLAWDAESKLNDITLNNLEHPALRGLNGEKVNGFVPDVGYLPENSNINNVFPEIYVEDSDAVALGINQDNGRTTFAARDFGDYKSVYIAAPKIPHKVMRSLLSWNNMTPILNTEDCLYCNGDIIGINATRDGDKTITMPDNFELENLWDGGKILSQNQQIKLNLKAKETFVGRLRNINN